MWGHTSSEEAFRRRASETLPETLHNSAAPPLEPIQNASASESDITSEQSGTPSKSNGTWGERDVGGPVDQKEAMRDFEELQQSLSRLSRTQSRASHRTGKSEATKGGILGRLASRISRRQSAAAPQADLEAASVDEFGSDDEKRDEDEEDDFHLEQFMREGRLEKRTESGESTKKLGVVFKGLTVRGVGGGASVVRTLPQAILGTFGPDLYRILSGWMPFLKLGRGEANLRTLIHDFTGVVRHGEMMLVLGRPGSGCSTFLRAIANNRAPFAAVEGDVTYGGIPADEVRRRYRGEVVYNGENDEHLPTLTVGQTLRFSLLNKTRKSLQADVELVIDAFLRMFAIRHTKDTLVGNAFVRGVSGGERKRVSIAETLATKSTVVCWDNSTRGLDASTALDYARSLRIMTDVSDRTTITTLYQAGEGIYELMDKVLVIDEGRMLFQGPARDARKYFEDLGFYAPPRQTTPDFLTSLCDPNSRQFRPGFEHRCPKTAEELERAFRSSPAYQRVLDDVAGFERHLDETAHADARNFEQSVQAAKSRRVASTSNYTVPFWRQVVACARREFWLLLGDRTEFYTKYFTIVSNGLLVGSMFYNTPASTGGAFLRSGAVFFGILFLGWLQLAELMKAVSGRPVINRHNEYAFYRPSAVAVARALVDLPVLVLQVVVFAIIIYFMAGLDLLPGKFFIYMLFVYVTTFTLTAMYRLFAALSPSIDDAVRFSGLAFNILVIYAGYIISKPTLLAQKVWFGWLAHINPLSYAFEAVVANEFSGRALACDPLHLVPQGPGILPENQGCAFPGAERGSSGAVPGDAYLGAQFAYSRANLWRNFGVILALGALYLMVTLVGIETFSFGGSGAGALVFKSSSKTRRQVAAAQGKPDEEQVVASGGSSATEVPPNGSGGGGTPLGDLTGSERVFTWEDVSYTVDTPAGPKKLLNKVSGYAKPGVMVALMGASGAGKTTLLNTLSQRQTVGVVRGSMLVDGRPLGSDFQRSTGFVEQMDLHDETATVREAIEFSALLRQSRDTPRAEKLAYVDRVVSLLELDAIQDAIVGSLGVEHKKRLTIAVELAAKPSLLLFLDEPTSGLDAQSAFSIIRFIKKLCAAGQAVICTIHQPSSDLIQEFDQILALSPGGNVIYSGAVGDDGSTVIEYFARRGVACPPGKNVAEFLLETAVKGARRPDGRRINWAEEWRESPEKRELMAEIERLKSDRTKALTATTTTTAASPTTTVAHEFAAPVSTQTVQLTKRMFRAQWRNPSYLYGRLFTAVVVAIFNGFTFWMLGDTVADMQSRVFTSFMIIVLPATVMNAVLPKFYMNRALWETREYPSRIYGWIAFCTAEVVSEIPGSLAGGVLYWVLWYLPTGMPRDPSTAGYTFIMSVLFFLFQSSWGQWICAWAPSFTVISNLLPLFLCVFALFNGVMVPYPQLNVFWKYWVYYLNPSTYWIAGILASTLPGTPVRCAPHEAAYFSPPANQTCADFAGSFVQGARQGYLMNPSDSSNCGYCPYADGSEYLASLGIDPAVKWRNFGIFLVFCVTNWMLVYFFIYTVRVKGWSFGFGPLTRGVSKLFGGIKGLFSRKKTTSE